MSRRSYHALPNKAFYLDPKDIVIWCHLLLRNQSFWCRCFFSNIEVVIARASAFLLAMSARQRHIEDLNLGGVDLSKSSLGKEIDIQFRSFSVWLMWDLSVRMPSITQCGGRLKLRGCCREQVVDPLRIRCSQTAWDGVRCVTCRPVHCSHHRHVFLLRDMMEVCNQCISSSCKRETFHQIQED